MSQSIRPFLLCLLGDPAQALPHPETLSGIYNSASILTVVTLKFLIKNMGGRNHSKLENVAKVIQENTHIPCTQIHLLFIYPFALSFLICSALSLLLVFCFIALLSSPMYQCTYIHLSIIYIIYSYIIIFLKNLRVNYIH